MSVAALLSQLVSFYETLIIAYIIMSWIRPTDGLIGDIYRVLGTITEPWLGIFRRFHTADRHDRRLADRGAYRAEDHRECAHTSVRFSIG